jgi:hypothetical protein
MNVIGYCQLAQCHAATSISAISPPPTPGYGLSHVLVPPVHVPPFRSLGRQLLVAAALRLICVHSVFTS